MCIGAPASKILSDRGVYIPNPVGLSATHRARWMVSGIRSQIATSASLRAPNASTNFPCSASAAASFVLVEMSGAAAMVAPAAAQIAHAMIPNLTIANPPHEISANPHRTQHGVRTDYRGCGDLYVNVMRRAPGLRAPGLRAPARSACHV